MSVEWFRTWAVYTLDDSVHLIAPVRGVHSLDVHCRCKPCTYSDGNWFYVIAHFVPDEWDHGIGSMQFDRHIVEAMEFAKYESAMIKSRQADALGEASPYILPFTGRRKQNPYRRQTP